MKLGELKPNEGSKKVGRRVGRGHGSGAGKTSGRGHKGQKSRTGYSAKLGFEGGQMPLYRRIPKRGHKCRNTKDIVAINLSKLDVFNDGDTVNLETLRSKGLVSKLRDGVKILGVGELNKKLVVQVNYFSESAKEKIEKAGGKAEVI